ncbi:glycosyltransferase family 1 protein [Demequina sp. NBRC 110055]|uniref:glycosyltransferase family 4 protein n=1 Tax=Demequina sp. NBRC 110055 TaxID=1570344 RepID=UPI0009FBA53F|nr:glycosyltransferase family 1 protein [Demequina sp. NBRC 110055]
MRVALVAESFLPHANGVTHSLMRVIEHLTAHGHEALVITPDPRGGHGPVRYGVAPVVRLPSVGWPGYPEVRVSVATVGRVTRLLEDFAPDVVHLASPLMLGWTAVRAADALGLPSVAIYQTEVPSYAARYRAPWGEQILWNRVRDLHRLADLTLVPSTHAHEQLAAHGVPRLRRWGRGVDTRRFDPRRRDDALRARWAPRGERIVGYVGRLAPEKRVEHLAQLAAVDHARLVIVGDGPSRAALEQAVPDAVFTGFLGGDALATAMASFDAFVHCGDLETFCQTIQEAHASGVPVVAPRRGGPIDLVDEGVTGYLYDPAQPQKLVAHVRAIVADDEWRDRAGAHARDAVRERTWDRVCAQLLNYYDEAIAARRGAPGPGITAVRAPA